MNTNTDQSSLKLFQLLLGSKAPQRNVEQHDFFFAIGTKLGDLVPEIKSFWPEAGDSIHIDGWREVTNVDGYGVRIRYRKESAAMVKERLFFLNLGGYTGGLLEEQHYTVLTVQQDKGTAVSYAKQMPFFKHNTLKGARSHIDEKYGVDVDDIYQVEDILPASQKKVYRIVLEKRNEPGAQDEIHLGYLKLHKIPTT